MWRGGWSSQLAQHVLENPPVAVVVGLLGGIDSDLGAEFDAGAVRIDRPDSDLGGHGIGGADSSEAGDGVGLRSSEAERIGAGSVGELEGKDAHADEVGSVDALEALRQDGAHTKEEGPLRRPVA